MNTPFTVSMELLAVGNKSFLALEIYGVLEKAKTKHDVFTSTSVEIIKLAEIIQRNTGIKIDVTYVDTPIIFGAILFPSTLGIHSNATSGLLNKVGVTTGITQLTSESTDKLYSGRVDLEKGRVDGLYHEFQFELVLTSGMYGLLDAAELTAIVLHEVGHAFTVLATLGEYVWMNFLMTEGIDILLGKKKNKYKVSFLDEKVPNEEEARKKIIESMVSRYRELHNPFVTLGTYKRSEQLADQFTARLGFGKPLVTALGKMDSHHGNQLTDYGSHGIVTAYRFAVQVIDVSKLFLMTIVPFWLILYIGGVISDTPVSSYDRPKERFIRVKRDLVIQLKQTTKPDLRENILADIKAIDVIISKMDEWNPLLTVIRDYANPVRRRSLQRFNLEKQLESLFANDLFVTAAKFKTLVNV